MTKTSERRPWTATVTKARLVAAGLAIALTGGLAVSPSAPLEAAQGNVALATSQPSMPGMSLTAPSRGDPGREAQPSRRDTSQGRYGNTDAPFQGAYELSCWQEGTKIIDRTRVSAPIAGDLTERDSAYFGQTSEDAKILIMVGESLCLASRP